MGRTTTDLFFYQVIGQIVSAFAVGYLFDIIGRRSVLVGSLLGFGFFLSLVPITSPNVYPWLAIIRFCIGLAATAPFANP